MIELNSQLSYAPPRLYWREPSRERIAPIELSICVCFSPSLFRVMRKRKLNIGADEGKKVWCMEGARAARFPAPTNRFVGQKSRAERDENMQDSGFSQNSKNKMYMIVVYVVALYLHIITRFSFSMYTQKNRSIIINIKKKRSTWLVSKQLDKNSGSHNNRMYNVFGTKRSARMLSVLIRSRQTYCKETKNIYNVPLSRTIRVFSFRACGAKSVSLAYSRGQQIHPYCYAYAQL